MFKTDVTSEKSMEEAVERRRSAETARKARIFNTRLRVMGLDVNALNQQVQEKRQQQNTDKQRDKTFDMLRKCQNDALLWQDLNEQEKRESLHKDLTQYWATEQRVEDSRDADLKCGLKGAFELIIPEAELGPASMKIFQGEDIGGNQMRREQIRQTERDLQAQMDENKKRHMGDKHRELQGNRELMHQHVEGVRHAALEEERKKAACIMLSGFNQALAAERAENLKEEHRREERENLAEICHIMTSDMMTEGASVAEKGVGRESPPHVLPDRWKGMTSEQLKTIHEERNQQRHEQQRKLDAAKMLDAAWDFQYLKLSREAEEEEKRVAALRREQRIQMDKYNKQLAIEQQLHQEYLDKKLYTNRPTKDYFHQFNTSSR
ncbi:RIB43A-like with coiled-coils protein 1 [Cololabis saira]|uniref:RIB43A-like with coiled-coils protein 1 n=1 Tax=Cololabis saira TaxID=129043 RepID=UPI002AD3CC9C|nr:RIB43A-like with coiled-coils protein 1 [Cololabis saira]